MLTWLRRLFTTRRDDREIFVYWDGEKHRRIDPLVAWRELWADTQIDLGKEYKVALNPLRTDGTAFYPDAMVDAAEQNLLALTRRVFGVQAWSESTPGLTVNETIELLAQFLKYRVDLKKKRGNSPTPLPATDTTEEPESVDSTPPESPPSFEPDLSATPTESTCGEPM